MEKLAEKAMSSGIVDKIASSSLAEKVVSSDLGQKIISSVAPTVPDKFEVYHHECYDKKFVSKEDSRES